MAGRRNPHVIPFRELSLDSLAETGGKNASLGELIRALAPKGVRVPDGFAVAAAAYRHQIEATGVADEIYSTLERLDVTDVEALRAAGHRIRGRVRSQPLAPEIAEAVIAAYAELSREYDQEEADVAVRSSATAEDLPTASFAGQQDTYLNIHGDEALLAAVRACMASLFTDRSSTAPSAASRTPTSRCRSECRRWSAAIWARPA